MEYYTLLAYSTLTVFTLMCVSVALKFQFQGVFQHFHCFSSGGLLYRGVLHCRLQLRITLLLNSKVTIKNVIEKLAAIQISLFISGLHNWTHKYCFTSRIYQSIADSSRLRVPRSLLLWAVRWVSPAQCLRYLHCSQFISQKWTICMLLCQRSDLAICGAIDSVSGSQPDYADYLLSDNLLHYWLLLLSTCYLLLLTAYNPVGGELATRIDWDLYRAYLMKCLQEERATFYPKNECKLCLVNKSQQSILSVTTLTRTLAKKVVTKMAFVQNENPSSKEPCYAQRIGR